MARTPKGKPLTYRGLRLDDDVWAECQRLGKEHGTINEGLRSQLFDNPVKPLSRAATERVMKRAAKLARPLLKRGPSERGGKSR